MSQTTNMYSGWLLEISQLFPSCFSIVSHFPLISLKFCSYFSAISHFLLISQLFLTFISHSSLISQLFLDFLHASQVFLTCFSIISQLISQLHFANLSHLPPDLLKLSSLQAFVMILEQLWKQRCTK